VFRHLEGNTWLSVSGSPGPQLLRRVLNSVDLAGRDVLTFPFRLSWAPAGYRVLSASSGAHYFLGDAAGTAHAAVPPLFDSGVILGPGALIPADGAGVLDVGVSREDGSYLDKGLTPNGTLLGRPSRYTEDADVAVLDVYGLNGMHISVTADTRGRPELTRAALERVVSGLRLVPRPTDPTTWTPDPLP
jgi:hypothetical protein